MLTAHLLGIIIAQNMGSAGSDCIQHGAAALRGQQSSDEFIRGFLHWVFDIGDVYDGQ